MFFLLLFEVSRKPMACGLTASLVVLCEFQIINSYILRSTVFTASKHWIIYTALLNLWPGYASLYKCIGYIVFILSSLFECELCILFCKSYDILSGRCRKPDMLVSVKIQLLHEHIQMVKSLLSRVLPVVKSKFSAWMHRYYQ